MQLSGYFVRTRMYTAQEIMYALGIEDEELYDVLVTRQGSTFYGDTVDVHVKTRVPEKHNAPDVG